MHIFEFCGMMSIHILFINQHTLCWFSGINLLEFDLDFLKGDVFLYLTLTLSVTDPFYIWPLSWLGIDLTCDRSCTSWPWLHQGIGLLYLTLTSSLMELLYLTLTSLWIELLHLTLTFIMNGAFVIDLDLIRGLVFFI